MNKNSIIYAKNLEKYFVVGDEPYGALRGVDVNIENEEITIIYGPSGSGKSTLLNCLIGLEPPTKGIISVNGERLDLKNEDERADVRARNFGVVHQQPIWVKALTVMENVSLPLVMEGICESDASKKALEALEVVGMTHLAKHKPSEISGGQQQCVSLARAIINDPKILVLDEPTGNLDTHSADHVMKLLQEFKLKQKKTIILVTHNLIYLPYADRTICIKDGLVEKIANNSNEIIGSLTNLKR